MRLGRSSRKQALARQGGPGRIIDTTGELPVVTRHTPLPRPVRDVEERSARNDTLYAPRERVTARPIGRPLSTTLLDAPELAPQPDTKRVAVASAPLRRFSIGRHFSWTRGQTHALVWPLRRFHGNMMRPKALIVYMVIFLLIAQTLVGALTPLGRSERQVVGGALLALGATTPATPTPFPLGPTPPPVSNPAAFITTMLPYAQQLHRDLGWPVSVTLAQMGVEHGWMFPDFDGWNLANSKVFPDPNGDGGVCYRQAVVRGFCYAPTPQIGVAIYEHVAHLTYYSAIAQSARAGGAVAAARALGQSPWDEAHYALNGAPGGKLIAAMNTYNLFQYDR